MARFRAWSTDSEEDSDLSDVEVERQAEAKSAPQSTDPAAPTIQLPRLATDESDEHEVEDDLEEPDYMVDDEEPLERQAGDTSLTPWAREVGVVPQTMHVMQTSLFHLPEEEAMIEDVQDSWIKQKYPRYPAPPVKKRGRDSDGDGLLVESRQVRLPLMMLGHSTSLSDLLMRSVPPSRKLWKPRHFAHRASIRA